MNREVLIPKISVIVHALVGLGVGALSWMLNGGIIAGVAGFGILIGLGFSIERIAGKKGLKWWAMNGLIVYLFFWLVGWTYLLNA